VTTAIIGTGNIGSMIARELAAGGEDVRLSSTSPEKTKALADEIGDRAAAAASNREAVESADTVILAVYLDAMSGVLKETSDALAGKLVVETTNPIGVDEKGEAVRSLPDGESSMARVADLLPSDVKFAKAFNALLVDQLTSAANREPKSAVLFYATDDDSAAEGVKTLIKTAGFDPVRVGGLSAAVRIEFGGELFAKVVDRDEATQLVSGA